MKHQFLSLKSILISGVLATMSLGSANQALAVTFDTQATVEKHNAGGVAYANLSYTSSAFCFLTQVQVEDTDAHAESARCRLVKGATVWVLEAYLGRSDDADVICSAVCYRN